MKESGFVTKINGDQALVTFQRTSACSKCGACGMLAGQNSVTINVANSLHAKEGDYIEVQFTTKNALQSSAIAYIFPLLMLLAGVFLGYSIPQTIFETRDVFAAIMGLIFTGIAFLVLKLLNPYFKRKFANVYTMVKIVKASE